uniref:Uncharacterized protein n=1 Tax=Anguilla anguilla TaxID=7936 RepID=A0A0E9SGK2_ANGAN
MMVYIYWDDSLSTERRVTTIPRTYKTAIHYTALQHLGVI